VCVLVHPKWTRFFTQSSESAIRLTISYIRHIQPITQVPHPSNTPFTQRTYPAIPPPLSLIPLSNDHCKTFTPPVPVRISTTDLSTMAQRVTLRKRQPYNTVSNRRRVVKTPGGKLVVHHLKKKAVSIGCGCGVVFWWNV